MSREEQLVRGLEEAFIQIHEERMAGLSILNPELTVEAVGFRPWREYCVGILITPWFMNLIVLSQEGEKWQDEKLGSRLQFDLPCGPRELTLCEEERVGRYQNESLFSPMSVFTDQGHAAATANSILERIMTAPERKEAEMAEVAHSANRRRLLRGLFLGERD